jgi:hypothetical protein
MFVSNRFCIFLLSMVAIARSTRPTPARSLEARKMEQKVGLALQFLIQSELAGTPVSIRYAAAQYGALPSTVHARYHGRKTRREAQVIRQLIPPEQEQVLVNWILFWSSKGMPLNTHALHAKAAVLAGQDVGQNWVNRFKVRHPILKTEWSSKVDYKRAKALNPAIVRDFYQKLIAELQGSCIPQCNIFNADEKGVKYGDDQRVKVFVSRRQKGARTVGNLNQELTTVIECVCADGTSIRPMIIFKGKKMSKYWFTQDSGGLDPV